MDTEERKMVFLAVAVISFILSVTGALIYDHERESVNHEGQIGICDAHGSDCYWVSRPYAVWPKVKVTQ